MWNLAGLRSAWCLLRTVRRAPSTRIVGALNDRSCAAIADRCNAGLYNLEVLKDSIEDNPDNYTRFVVLACHNGKYERCPEISGKGDVNKVSFTFTTQNKVGALFDCLCVCKDAGLNLTKLESRPIPGCPWSYRFFADAAIPSGSEGPEHAVTSFTEMLRKVTEEIRILGVYRE